MILSNILGQNLFMRYFTLCFHPFFTSFDAPVPILTHLGASFDSPEAFFLVICNIFINMVLTNWITAHHEDQGTITYLLDETCDQGLI